MTVVSFPTIGLKKSKPHAEDREDDNVVDEKGSWLFRLEVTSFGRYVGLIDAWPNDWAASPRS